jgi:EAL domain-containing protein (putative c-di-GMP-specific phosphodiesterase class I)
MSLAINVSASALLANSTIQTILRDDAAGARLVLELSEHHSITQPEELSEVLADLRMAGVRIAIDDVGSGYAGLERIVLIAPEVLKLDRALIQGIADHSGRQALCEAMVGFAQRTGTLMIVEGVETDADLRTLRSLGVAHAQGFLLGRPSHFDVRSVASEGPHCATPV